MRPSAFIILRTVHRLSYKTTVALNIYITTCYAIMSNDYAVFCRILEGEDISKDNASQNV